MCRTKGLCIASASAYRDPDEAGKVRGDLARQGIEVTVVKP